MTGWIAGYLDRPIDDPTINFCDQRDRSATGRNPQALFFPPASQSAIRINSSRKAM